LLIELYKEGKTSVINNAVFASIILIPFTGTFSLKKYKRIPSRHRVIVDKMIAAGMYDKFYNTKIDENDPELVKTIKNILQG